MKTQLVECSHIGGRETNQDYFSHVIDTDWALFCVADGLGGHDFGELASQFLLEALISLSPKYAEDMASSPSTAMEAMIAEAARIFRERAEERCPSKDPQTTLALAWIDPNHLITAHIGDSRIYRLNGQKVQWRSPDHTMVQTYFEEGKIKEEEMAEHPLQNRLLKSVCTYDSPNPEILVHPSLSSEESLILCTDGFWSACTPKEMLALVNAKDSKKKLNKIVNDIAQKDPESDNITVQVVKKIEF